MRQLFAFIARLIGFLLLLAAFAVLGHDLLAWRENGVFTPTSIGQLWHYVHRPSLSAIQEAVQRYIAPELWDPGIISALRLWAVLMLGLPGIFLAWRYRKRRR